MSILKKKPSNDEYDAFTIDGHKGTLRYVATARGKGLMTIDLLQNVDYYDDPICIARFENVPSEVFEDAVKKRMFRDMVQRSGNKYDWYDDTKWKIALIPADEQSKVMDSAMLNRFEVAIIERCRLNDLGSSMSCAGITPPQSYEEALKKAQAEVDSYRRILLGLEKEGDADGLDD